LGTQFDELVYRDFSTPRVKVSKDPQGLVSQACIAGAYMYLFFSVSAISDHSETPLDPHALWLGLSHFFLGRLAKLIKDVMSLALIRPMTRNARLSLAAIHVVVNRVKIFTSRLRHLRTFYVSFPTLLKVKKVR
jgi:hypothetical protein